MIKAEVLAKSFSKLMGLNPEVRNRAIFLIGRSFDIGVNIIITQGLRTIAQQNDLYAQGRTKAGKIVTNAKGGNSYHNYGLAIDFVTIDVHGNPVWVVNNNWMKVVAIAKSLGFEWGGDFKTITDNPHFQISGGLSINELKSGMRPNIKPLLEVEEMDWKQEIIENAKKAGIIAGEHKPDDVAEKWFVLQVALNVLNKKE